MPFSLSPGCGLDWTLPQAHFEGVDEQGYVAYWEKIGQADLGDGLVMPVHINFNSHRETSSPTLGKGWMLPLLESHVEPVDENTVHVIMPDGWIFVFYRNGNTDTWRGNAGWVGETDGPRFTATAPCGWRVKFDTGKILEIDTPKNRTISIKYNGPAPLEADIDNQPFVQVAQNTTTGVAQSITIGGQKIPISQAQRPRIQVIAGKNLITGFDQSLSQLQWPDGKQETFNFGPPQDLTPTVAISKPGQPLRKLTWDPTTRQIKTDTDWTYTFTPIEGLYPTVQKRTDATGHFDSFEYDTTSGFEDINMCGIETKTYHFAEGSLLGKTRKIEALVNDRLIEQRSFAFDEGGRLIREMDSGNDNEVLLYKYDAKGNLSSTSKNGRIVFASQYDSAGQLLKVIEDNATITINYLTDGTEVRTIQSNYGTELDTIRGEKVISKSRPRSSRKVSVRSGKWDSYK